MDYTPRPKISIGAVAGALVTVLVTLAESYGIQITPELAGALVIIFGFGAAYVFPESGTFDPPSKAKKDDLYKG